MVTLTVRLIVLFFMKTYNFFTANILQLNREVLNKLLKQLAFSIKGSQSSFTIPVEASLKRIALEAIRVFSQGVLRNFY